MLGYCGNIAVTSFIVKSVYFKLLCLVSWTDRRFRYSSQVSGRFVMEASDTFAKRMEQYANHTAFVCGLITVAVH